MADVAGEHRAAEPVRTGRREPADGSLVIGVVSTAVCSVLPELLRSFRREQPFDVAVAHDQS